MGQPLRILLIEDCLEDADLLLLELRRSGYEPSAVRVDSSEGMLAALTQSSWDVVISDYVMPGFGGLEALELFKLRGLEIPFIIVSGHIGEEVAVSALKAGADDYVMKDRLARLAPVIDRALQEKQIARAHRAANEALRENEERFRQLAENIGAVFFMFERLHGEAPATISYVSRAYERIWGYPCQTLFRDPDSWLLAIYPADRQRIAQSWLRAAQLNLSEEFRILRLDLQTRWIHLRTFAVKDARGVVYRVAAIAEDITDRKRAEQELAANASRLQDTVEELRVIEEQLRKSNDDLSRARADLEKRVEERTADLKTANAELQCQINERKRLEGELLEIAENERRRIGFDLHDDIGQKLMGMSLLLKALETRLQHKEISEAGHVQEIQNLVGQVINHTHNLAHCFSELDDQSDDLGVLLRKLLANVRRTFHITSQFHAATGIPPLSGNVTTQLYKIAQEALSNAIKHGKATRITISLGHRTGGLELRIENDGIPFPTSYQPTNRMGLRIMTYRAHTIGGTFDIRPTGDNGTVVTCTVPLVNGFSGVAPSSKGNGSSFQDQARKTVTELTA